MIHGCELREFQLKTVESTHSEGIEEQLKKQDATIQGILEIKMMIGNSWKKG